MSRPRVAPFLFALSLPFWLACTAFGQMKIGIIDLQSAMSQTAEIKKAQADLEAKYKSRQDLLAKAQKELDVINQQLSLGDKLTPQAQNDLSAQATRKERDISRLQEDLQADVDRDRTEILAKANDRMQKIVATLAEQKGLDAVLVTGAAAYFKPALDLSKEAAAAYDKTYPVK